MVKEVINHFRSILTPEGGVPRRAETIHNNNNNKAVLTSTLNLCLRAKIRKKYTPVKPRFYYINVGCKGCKLHGPAEHSL